MSLPPGVLIGHAQQCIVGQIAQVNGGDGEEGLVKKLTGLMTNSWCAAETLDKQCHGGHVHAGLIEHGEAEAAVYPRAMCESICVAVQGQTEFDMMHDENVLYMSGKNKTAAIHNKGEIEEVNLLEGVFV